MFVSIGVSLLLGGNIVYDQQLVRTQDDDEDMALWGERIGSFDFKGKGVLRGHDEDDSLAHGYSIILLLGTRVQIPSLVKSSV